MVLIAEMVIAIIIVGSVFIDIIILSNFKQKIENDVKFIQESRELNLETLKEIKERIEIFNNYIRKSEQNYEKYKKGVEEMLKKTNDTKQVTKDVLEKVLKKLLSRSTNEDKNNSWFKSNGVYIRNYNGIVYPV